MHFNKSCRDSKTCDIFTTRMARRSFPKRSIRRKVGEIGKAAAKSSTQLLQTTTKSTQLNKFLKYNLKEK